MVSGMKGKRLVITCGGTGGHFYPGVSVARHCRDAGGEVLLLLSGSHAADQAARARRFGLDAVELPAMPSPGGHPGRCCRFGLGLVKGFFAANRALKRFRPEAVLGMGSFASLPVVLAGRFRRVPVYLHDGNARIGRANRLLARIARALGTAFPAVNGESVPKRCRLHCTGMPLRPELLQAAAPGPAEAIGELNALYRAHLSPERLTILIFGGSQGAATLNRNLPAAISNLPPGELQVIHLAGPDKLDEVRAAYERAAFPVLPLPYCDRMELLYRAADLVISRSGGSTVAELAFFGKPAVLIPYPYAAEGHQRDNARFLSENDAAVTIRDAECTPAAAMKIVASFLDNPDEWAQRGRNAAALARPDASKALLNLIFAEN